MTEYIFTANYKPVEEQPIVILFDELHKELYDRGWTVHWEFNSEIDPALLKYNNCITVENCATVNPEYAYDVDGNGAWNYRLDNLETADNMFVVDMNEVSTIVGSMQTPIGSPALVSFNADLPKVTAGSTMFAGCSNLTTFNGDLSNLSAGYCMFANCTNLKSFTSDLSSLIFPAFMFGGNYDTYDRIVYDAVLSDIDISAISPDQIEGIIESYQHQIGSPTSLDLASVQNIADTINDISNITPPADLDSATAALWGWLIIGIDPTLKGNSDIEAALTTIRNKGWDVTPIYGSDPSPTTPGEGLLKYNNCRTWAHCKTINSNVYKDVDENGAWNYRLDNLKVAFGEISGKLGGLFLTPTADPNTELVSFNVDLPKMIHGLMMFAMCKSLTSFNGALPRLISGFGMFQMCEKLTEWNTPLPNLTDGGGMFGWCKKLTEWNTPLPNLTNGDNMFIGCSGLASFNVDLPNLTNGDWMFGGCTGLTSWNIDLPKLTNGTDMFSECTGLTKFSGALYSLTNGTKMFGYRSKFCSKLDLESVQNIANTINDLTGKTSDDTEGWGEIHIGMDSALQSDDETAPINVALAAIRAKGWTVTEIYYAAA